MFRTIAVMIAALAATPLAATPTSTASYDYAVVGYYDGDTFYIRMPGLPPELQRIGVRVRGIDTPEIRGKCDQEKYNAKAAAAFTRRLILQNGSKITVTGLKWDKYGGRVDADVYLSGRKLADLMIQNGYARPYSGGKRQGWCQ